MALKTPPVVDELEDLASAELKRLNLDQVKSFVSGLKACTSAPEIAATTGLSEDEVIDLGAKLGTWLTHVLGSVDVEINLAAKEAQPQLFQTGSEVVIPLGFERRAKQRRDIVRALATIVTHDPDETTLSRFLDRLYPSRTSVLTARDVFMVWRFAQLGRLDGLSKISTNPAFNRTMASAYYTLDTAVKDAESAIDVLRDPNSTAPSVSEACVKARWVHEARISKIERLANQAQVGKVSEEILRRDLRSFAREYDAYPRLWTFTSVAELSEGQVLRIVQAAGLAGETGRKEALEIRTRLVELGEEHGFDLAKDLDRLVPEGLRARRAGVENLFWMAIHARMDGDPEWRSIFEDAITEHAAENLVSEVV
jgi:hypothetical protein